MQFLIDMNLTPRWADYLSEAGYRAAHWSALGDSTAPDTDICQFARVHKMIIVTNDLDFPQIPGHTRDSGPSIVLMRGYPLTPDERGPALLDAIQKAERELREGAILSLNLTGRPRARMLPL